MSTGIPYLDEVWNPITGCSNTACPTRSTCWARDIIRRFPDIHSAGWKIDPFRTVNFDPFRLDKPLHWRKPRRIGLCFLGDWMDSQVTKTWLCRIISIIRSCPHQFFSLTKHSERLSIIPELLKNNFPPYNSNGELDNLYNGITVTCQTDADRMIPELLKVPGKHWLSYEPALGPVDFDHYTCLNCGRSFAKNKSMKALKVKCPFCDHCDEFISPNIIPWLGYSISARYKKTWSKINWIVIGSHNQPRKYPCDIRWIENAVEQAQAADVPVFVKQAHVNGKLVKMPEILGKVWDEYPK